MKYKYLPMINSQNKHQLDKHTENIIGYSVNGEKLTLSKLKTEVEEARARIKAGQFVEHSRLVEESKNW